MAVDFRENAKPEKRLWLSSKAGITGDESLKFRAVS